MVSPESSQETTREMRPDAAEVELGEAPWFRLAHYAIPLPDSFAAALGQVLVTWGAFENDIYRDMTLMMRFPIVRALSDERARSFKSLIELWRRSVRVLFPDAEIYQKVAVSLTKDAKALSKKRNRLVHGHWAVLAEENHELRWIVFSEMGYDQSNIDGVYVSEADARETIEHIRVLRIAFVELVVNRLWHAQIGILRESHEPTHDNPAHLTLQTGGWSLGKASQLDPMIPERLAKTFLFRD